jgi:hypothetical protein
VVISIQRRIKYNVFDDCSSCASITVADGARRSGFCNDRSGLGLGGSDASWTSAAPRLTGAPSATAAPKKAAHFGHADL